MNLEELLFLLIRSEICGICLSEEEKSQLTPEKITELYLLSKQHGMSHVIASALKKADLPAADEMRSRLDEEFMRAIYNDSQREYTFLEICSVLETEKIPYLPLKGSVVSTYYPQTWMRSSCDIDILIPSEQAEQAVQCLCRTGYECEGVARHDYSLHSPSGIHVELHFTLEQMEFPRADEILKTVWQHANLKQGSAYCYEMEPELFLFYHVAHMGKHLLHGGCGFRSLIDLWLLEQNMLYDKEKLNSLLADGCLLEFWNTADRLAKEWMEGILHTEKTKLLADYILQGGNYGTLKNMAQIDAGKGEGKLKSFFKLVFLSNADLAIRYPILREHPYWYPLYCVRRWFRIFQKSKRKKLVDKVTIRNHITENETEHSRRMLEQLGLPEAVRR